MTPPNSSMYPRHTVCGVAYASNRTTPTRRGTHPDTEALALGVRFALTCRAPRWDPLYEIAFNPQVP